MPDIAKCTNEQCPAKKKCYRYTCEPSDFLQTYADFYPDPIDGICMDFMPIYEKYDKKDKYIDK